MRRRLRAVQHHRRVADAERGLARAEVTSSLYERRVGPEVSDDGTAWWNDCNTEVTLVTLDRFTVELDPDLVADVPPQLVVEHLAVEALRRAAESEIAIANAEDENTSPIVMKGEDMARNTRPFVVTLWHVRLVVP